MSEMTKRTALLGSGEECACDGDDKKTCMRSRRRQVHVWRERQRGDE